LACSITNVAAPRLKATQVVRTADRRRRLAAVLRVRLRLLD
jgi:hypothetical protein